ncbi:hypothetical protein N0V90_012469 [Kalmusia sp. IMI 367209]|nr:hypothetical protein N0V90_012469 [Kalmusia sp. IMI 367209]
MTLKNASAEERDRILNAITITDGKVHLPQIEPSATITEPVPMNIELNGTINPENLIGGSDEGDDELEPSNILTIDEAGRNQLIANAALQRQREHRLTRLHTIAGEPSELALHLLDLHWNRQHHTFLLTYRPAIMRDIVTDGPWSSEFLLNAIFACVSKFSERVEVRDSPSEPETAGRRFFVRCEELLSREALLSTSSLPTVVALLLLGGTFNARGQASKSWLYTGYALRMVFDLNLHQDCKDAGTSPEDVEIRRRIFWGAFIVDKLQSLYHGRPISLRLRDAQVSRDFMDTLEENELWTPYYDLQHPDVARPCMVPPIPTYSVSTFQQLCLLAKISAKIINKFYAAGATFNSAHLHLQAVDSSLSDWYSALPTHLAFEPWSRTTAPEKPTMAPPNGITLLTTYNALVILLHRPFIFDGHLRPATISTTSWKRCTTAARNITSLATSYQKAYSLRGAPYLLSYAVYNACTVHVRNIAATELGGREEHTAALVSSLRCLDELTVANTGVSSDAGIIRQLAAANGVSNASVDRMETVMAWDEQTPNSQDWDALCRLFPPLSPNFTDLTYPQSLTAFGSHEYDSLQYWVDTYMPTMNGDPASGSNNTS